MALPSPANLRGKGLVRGSLERHIRGLQSSDRLSGVDLGELREEFDAFLATHEVVKARNNTVAAAAISTTETVEQSVTLSIPTHWAGYEIEAEAVMDIFESGTLTAIRTVTTRLRLTNAAGTLFGTSVGHIDTVQPNRFQQPTNGFLLGQTATGSVVVVWTAQLAADSGQASWDNGVLIATAYRTS